MDPALVIDLLRDGVPGLVELFLYSDISAIAGAADLHSKLVRTHIYVNHPSPLPDTLPKLKEASIYAWKKSSAVNPVLRRLLEIAPLLSRICVYGLSLDELYLILDGWPKTGPKLEPGERIDVCISVRYQQAQGCAKPVCDRGSVFARYTRNHYSCNRAVGNSRAGVFSRDGQGDLDRVGRNGKSGQAGWDQNSEEAGAEVDLDLGNSRCRFLKY